MTRPRIPLTLPGQAALLATLGVFFEALIMLRVTGGVAVGDALLMASGLLLVAHALRSHSPLWMPAWMLVALALIAGGTLIDALFVGRHNRTDVVVALELAFCVVILPAIVASQSPDLSVARRLLLAWIAGNLVGAGIAYMQFRWFDLGPFNRWLVWNAGRVAGLTPNPNTLGASLALLAPMCLAFAAEARRPFRMLLWATASFICFYVIDLTGSRTALVSALLGSCVVALLFGVHTRPAELPMRALQTITLVALVTLAWHLRSGYHDSAIERIFGSSPTAALSAYFRGLLHRASIDAISAAPFLGYGYSSMGWAAHNVPMAMIQGGGLAAFSGFVVAQAGLLTAAVRLYFRSRGHDASQAISMGLLGVWCTWLALGAYDVSILNRNAYFACAIAVLWLNTGALARRPAPVSVAPALV